MQLERVTIFTPFLADTTRGNAAQARRRAALLESRGVAVQLVDLSRGLPQAAVAEIRAFAPQVLYALHAWRVGPTALDVARELGVPLAVGLTGTDVFGDHENASTWDVTCNVLRAAAVITLQHELQREPVLVHCGEALRVRMALVPPSVAIPDPVVLRPRVFRERLDVPAGTPVVLQVAGLRSTKNVVGALRIMDRVRRERDCVFVIAGEALDETYAAEVRLMLRERPWARLLEAVPFADMPDLYAAADVVLNTSKVEGLSNALLEAMACGRAVVASDIPGNRAALRHGESGLLYREAEEAETWLLTLLKDTALVARLGAGALLHVQRRHNAAIEGDALVAALTRALNESGNGGAPSGADDSTDALLALARLNPTPLNRAAYALAAGAGMALTVDLVITLVQGEGYQYVRHTVGLLALVWLSRMYARTVRAAVRILGRLATAMVNRHAPLDWSVERRAALTAALPYEALARTFALFGMGALRRALERAIRRQLREESR